jgi:hypothetical protein
MKRLHREREQAERDLRERQAANAFLAAKFEEMVAWHKTRYGHLFATSWMYRDAWCPCCGKRRVAIWETQGQYMASLNGFIYNEQRVLIGYLLCQACALALLETSKQRQVVMHQRIEGCLIAAYQRYQAESGPPGGVESSI